MRNPLRRLDEHAAAEDARMTAAGYTVQATGRWARTYRPDPEHRVRLQNEAEQQRVAAMARRAGELFTAVFPDAAADLAERATAAANTATNP